MKRNKEVHSPEFLTLEEKYEVGRTNKREAEKNALINTNFINGKQNIRFNQASNIIEEIPYDKNKTYRATESFNMIRPLRNTVIKYIRDKIPVPRALPRTQNDEDIDTAKATTAVLNDLYERQHLKKVLQKVSRDAVDIGPAFIHVKWNPKKGNVVISDVNELLGDSEILFDQKQKEEIARKITMSGQLMTGDVEIEYVNMYEMFVGDAYEQEIQDQPWIIRAKSVDKDVAEKIYGVEFLHEDNVGKLTNQEINGSHNDMLVRNLGVVGTQRADNKVIIKEYFEKPSVLYPDGRYVLFGGGIIIKEEKLPYINGEYGTREYPFVKIGLDTPGLFYSHAFIEDLKPIQRRYNAVRNRKYEYINKNVNGQLLIEEGSINSDDKITNRPGDIIYYKRGWRPPTVMTSSGTGTLDVDSELASLQREFVSAVGVSTLSTAGTPQTSAVRGASMAQTLIESDESKFALIVDAVSDAVVIMSKQVIRLYKQFMNPDEVRFIRFSKDINGRIDWTSDILVENIVIKNKALLTTTDARRKQDVMDLMRMGILNTDSPLGPSLTIKLLEELNIGIPIDELPMKGSADAKKAKRENNLMTQKLAQITVDELDDHSIHFDVHADFMKSDEYRKMVMFNPDIEQVMRAHVQQHQQIVNQRQLAARAEAITKNK